MRKLKVIPGGRKTVTDCEASHSVDVTSAKQKVHTDCEDVEMDYFGLGKYLSEKAVKESKPNHRVEWLTKRLSELHYKQFLAITSQREFSASELIESGREMELIHQELRKIAKEEVN